MQLQRILILYAGRNMQIACQSPRQEKGLGLVRYKNEHLFYLSAGKQAIRPAIL